MLLTVHLHFTQFNPVVFSIPFRIRRMGSVVVVYDISPVVRTCNVDRIRYRGSGVVGVSKTQHSVLFFLLSWKCRQKIPGRTEWHHCSHLLNKKQVNLLKNNFNTTDRTTCIYAADQPPPPTTHTHTNHHLKLK